MLLVYAFLDEFVLLYPLYTLLFAHTGLSGAQISSLLALWSLTEVVLEVPSGALADALSRRALLVVGPVLGAAGFALWVAAPSYPAFAVGFVLWGAKGALVSGALEALVYTELDRQGAAARFGALLGRARAAGGAGVIVATALAAPVVAAGGYAAVGAGSVAAGLAAAAAALAFPEHREQEGARGAAAPPGRTEPDDDPPVGGYLATLRSGLREVRAQRGVRHLLVLAAGVAAVWGALEEYTPLLAVEVGVRTDDVPWWQLLIWGTITAGSLAAARLSGLRPRGLALLLVAAAAVLAVGAASAVPAGLVAVAAGLGALQAADVLAGARLQHALTGPARATVTSLAAVGAELVALAVYAAYGVLDEALGAGGAVAVLATGYVPLAWWALREDGDMPPHRADMFVEPGQDPRHDGPSPSGELGTLLDYLTYQRRTLELKCQGLDAAALARRSVEPSTLSLLGLVRHLADVERTWFRQRMAGTDAVRRFSGPDDPDGDFDGARPDDALVEQAWAAWREEVAFSDAFVQGAAGPEVTGTMPDGARVTLREVLVHMVEEYARHNGHADLLRERIDGRIGQ